jgi:hypothetical protein
MADLLRVQSDFAAALRDAGAAPAAAQWLAGDPEQARRRLAIYRANVAAASARALGAAYPVVRQVVGEEFFDALARAHLAAHPSTSGDLHEYGAGFAGFVAAFPHTQSLPYLPDLARLEWAVHRAYGAADESALDGAALAAVPPARQGGLRFVLAPGCAVVESAHPVLRIWQIHQPGFEGEFGVDWTVAERVLVAREGLRVDASALGAGEAAFVRAVLAGDDFQQAAADAFAADAGVDLGGLLGRLLAAGLITDFSIPQELP